MDDRRFRSKIDAWLAISVAALLGLPLLLSTGSIRGGNAPLWMLVVLLVPVAFVLWIFASTYYVVTATHLVVRSGPVNRRIPLKSITGIRPTRNPLSSPALSLDRLEIEYDSSSILVSPAEKDEFVRALQAGGAIVAVPSGTPSRAAKKFGRVLIFFVLPLVVIIAVLVYRQAQPAVVGFSDGRIRIDASPRQDVPVTEIIGLTLETSMPRILVKRNGLNFGQILHGHFRLEGVPDALLYLQASRQPPYVKLETRTRLIFINYKEPERTRALYEQLTRDINR